MPVVCDVCDIRWPDAVNPDNQGLVGIEYCPSCGKALSSDATGVAD